MKILAFDTSASAASVALIDGNKLLGEFFIDTKLTHSQTIMPMLQSLLQSVQYSINDVDIFAISNGPGSFTGLRIGISAIKGIAFVTDKPCIEISTLEAMAYSISIVDGIICSVMDARCNQVYNAIFKSNGKEITRLTEDRAISINSLKEKLRDFNSEKIFIVGDGALLCYNNFAKDLDNINLVPSHLISQRASGVCIAASKKGKSYFKDALTLSPYYLRLPQAQRELMAKKAIFKEKEENI